MSVIWPFATRTLSRRWTCRTRLTHPRMRWRVCTQRAGPEPPSGEEYAAFTNARLRGSCHCQQAHFFALSWIVTPREGYADASDGEQVCRGRGREADR